MSWVQMQACVFYPPVSDHVAPRKMSVVSLSSHCFTDFCVSEGITALSVTSKPLTLLLGTSLCDVAVVIASQHEPTTPGDGSSCVSDWKPIKPLRP